MKLRIISNENILLGISENRLVTYNRSTRKTALTTNLGDVLWEKQCLLGKAYFIDNRILFTSDDECIFVDSLTGETLDICPIHYEGHNDNVIIGEQVIDDEDYTITYNYKQNKILWNNKYNIASRNFLNENSFYSLRFDENYRLMPVLFCINIQTGSPLWQFSVSDFPPYINGFYREQEADIKQIIGVYKDLLWIHVGGFRLVGIDINTGKMVHLIKDVLKGENENNFLDKKNGTLKILSYDYYAEFDLQTLQFRKQIIIKSELDIKIRASSFYEGDKYLYFCGYHDNKFDKPNVFGIFDTDIAEIIWYDITKDDLGYFYNPPQVNDNLLVILDDKQNLLIYERYNKVNKPSEL